jgi:hypothetical protein
MKALVILGISAFCTAVWVVVVYAAGLLIADTFGVPMLPPVWFRWFAVGMFLVDALFLELWTTGTIRCEAI